jgi:hypothetical protein
MASVVVKLLQARGSLSQRQSATANKLLWTLLHRPCVEFQEARAAVGRGAFDQIVVPVIIDGQSLASLARRYELPQASISGRLRSAMDTLVEHFEVHHALTSRYQAGCTTLAHVLRPDAS